MSEEEDSQKPVTKPFKFCTGADGRFPNMNQTKRCWVNYCEYHKCINAKGKEFEPCKYFYHEYTAMCPISWHKRWDDQREAGTFPAKLD